MWLPTWVGKSLALGALTLVPWSLWLGLTLPRRAQAYHWGAAWAGFDLLLSIALALTGIGLWRHSHWVLGAAGAAAAMLACDAWFDVLTSSPQARTVAIGEAALLELPLAFLCLWLAARAGRSVRRTEAFADSALRIRATRAIRTARDGSLP